MRYEYITDTLEIAGSNTILMDGNVHELKAFNATLTFVSWNEATKVLVMTVVGGNLAPYGIVNFTDGSNIDGFNYEISSVSGSTITCLAHRSTEDATLVSGVSSGTHVKTITGREGVKIINNCPAAIAIGFNANIAVGGNGIQIPAGESEVLPLSDNVKVYGVGAAGNITIIEYK